MTPSTDTAVRLAIEKYWRTKSDEELAKGLNLQVEEVINMRKELKIVRNKKGEESLKDFARRYLLELPEEKKLEWIESQSKELIWKMAEGSPPSTGEININNEPIRIDITHQLLKVYGPKGISHIEMPTNSEGTRLAQRSGE